MQAYEITRHIVAFVSDYIPELEREIELRKSHEIKLPDDADDGTCLTVIGDCWSNLINLTTELPIPNPKGPESNSCCYQLSGVMHDSVDLLKLKGQWWVY